ncbi:bola protein, partial [Piptocephalis cylindrospora]
IQASLAPTSLDIVNDSASHAHHDAMRGNTSPETHFTITVVSEAFQGKGLVQRHRMVHKLLQEEMDAGLHALVLNTKTPKEMGQE